MTASNSGQETPQVLGKLRRSFSFLQISKFAFVASMVALPFFCAPRAALADSVEETAQVCSGCHGEQGVPMDKTFPVIWGQRRDYILKQLWDFKTGHRKNDVMAPIVESLSKSDMEELATYFSKQKWPKLDQPPASDDVKTKAWDVIARLNCQGCHQRDFQGDHQRPALSGQQDEYLLKTMTDFHTGDRANYPAMQALMRSLSEDELKPVATFLAGLPPEAAQIGQK